ncbi:MAG: methyltransferase domain-containing protein [Gemmatimonadaceae bacterium]
MRDVERANSIFGGRRAVLAEFHGILRELPQSASMLDVGTGRGDIPLAARRAAATRGITLLTVGIDMSPALFMTPGGNEAFVQGDAMALPFSDASIDVVIASQVLHHFPADAAHQVVSEMNRVARRRVIVSDLRRSVVAAAGLWLSSFPLGFHPVSRHDGVVSVMRGFLPFELADIVEGATRQRPVVVRRLGFRLTTSWKPQ